MSSGFDTPEQAALASFSAGAGAFVVRTEIIDVDHVDVIVDTAPSHPMRCHSFRADGRWYDGGDITE
jgi:hypothetical protein